MTGQNKKAQSWKSTDRNSLVSKRPVDVSVSGQPTLTDIRVYLMNELPYYERDDKDKYFYIATVSDIDRIAIGLMKLFDKNG